MGCSTCGPPAARAEVGAGDCVAGIAEESAGDYDVGKVYEELSLTYPCLSTHALSDVKVRLYVPTVRLIESVCLLLTHGNDIALTGH